MFDNSKKLNKEYADFLEEKASHLSDRLDNRSKDMDKDIMLWLCRAFAVVAFIVGILYIVLFIHGIIHS